MNQKIIKVSTNTQKAPLPLGPYTQSVAFSHYNNISAQLPIDPQSGNIVEGGIKEQALQCLNNIKAIVESTQHTMENVVKVTIFLKDISDIDAVDEVYSSFFTKYLPTRTTLAVADLPSQALIQIEAIISNGEGTPPQASCNLIKLDRNTNQAPQNMGPSTQTVAFSHYNNIGAQLPLDPKTGKIIEGGVKEQTSQCLKNIELILKSIGHQKNDIVKVTLFVSSLNLMDEVNKVYLEFFDTYLPARTVLIASQLPSNALVQAEAVVSHGDGTPPQLPEDSRFLVIEASSTEKAPSGPYSQTVAFSHYNHIAGQLPINVETGQIVEGGIKEQTKECLTNIKAIIESVDHVMDDTVKINIALKNICDIESVNEVYKTFFTEDFPARTLFAVKEIPMGALIQIDAVVSNSESTPPAV